MPGTFVAVVLALLCCWSLFLIWNAIIPERKEDDVGILLSSLEERTVMLERQMNQSILQRHEIDEMTREVVNLRTAHSGASNDFLSNHSTASSGDPAIHDLKRTKKSFNKSDFVTSQSIPPFCISKSNGAIYEMSQTLLTRRILKAFRPNNKYITLDVGAAFGWYSMYWAMLGYRVIAFDPGDTSYLRDAASCQGLEDWRLTIHNVAVGLVGGHGSGVSTTDVQNENRKSTSSLRPYIKSVDNRLVEVAIMKIDVEGSELNVLRDILIMQASNFVIYNIIVEFTPKWWPEGIDEGKKVLEALIAANWTFFTSPWSEHAARIGHPPHHVHPPDTKVDWDIESLAYVQHVPKEKVVDYVLSIKYQRDFWLQNSMVDDRFKLDALKNGIGDVLCDNADEWRYIELPTYLRDNPKHVEDNKKCSDWYHTKKHI